MASLQQQFVISTKNHTNVQIIQEEYRSVIDVEEDCRNREKTNSGFQDVKRSDGWGWNGVKSYDEALDFLRNGYVDKVDAIRKEVEKTTRGLDKRIKFENDIVGYAPVVPLAILGVPNSMINSKMKQIKAKVLDLYYDMGCECGTDSNDIIRVGTEFLKVVAGMEMQGYRINLTAIQTYTDSRCSNILKIRLKNANQPLDLKRISFPTIHTAFFRVIGFDWYSKTPKGKYLFGYGHSLVREYSNAKSYFDKDAVEELMEFKNKVFGENSIYIPARFLVNEDPKKVAEKIKEMIDYECKINNS